ncbi:MAG: NAD(P)H-binding protein [Polyangiaceae bacterium]
MNFLILGASGGVGKHAVERAAARGHRVTAMARDGSEANVPDGVRLFRGSPLDRTALDAALDGQDVVLSCLGLRRANPRNPWSALTSPPDLMEKVMAELVPAMKARGVKRIVAVSSAGVAESFPKMNFVMRFLVRRSTIGAAYRDLANMEAALAASGLDWVAVRPVTLTNRPREERVDVVDGFAMTATISRRTVAEWMIERAEDTAPITDHLPTIAGTPR